MLKHFDLKYFSSIEFLNALVLQATNFSWLHPKKVILLSLAVFKTKKLYFKAIWKLRYRMNLGNKFTKMSTGV